MTAAPAETENIIRDTSVRLADLGTIREHLLRERARRLDVVVSRRMICSAEGFLLVRPGDSTQIVSDQGVTSAAGMYRPTVTSVETMGKMLQADIGFLKKLYEQGRTDIIDAIFNGRLHGDVFGRIEGEPDGFGDFAGPPDYAPYGKDMMLRLLKADDSEEGIFRAMVSPRFRTDMDNFDVATAVMDGIAQAGVTAFPDVCSLTDRKMTLRFVVPEIAALAPGLLDGYRSPLDGPGGVQRAGMDRPGMRLRVENGWQNWTVPQALRAAGHAPMEHVVFAGLVVTNGDTGSAARTIAPQIRIQVCKNGLTLLAESDRRTHLGSTQSEGVVAYAQDTMDAELALITKQARDAVITYLNPEWFQAQVSEIEALARTPMEDPEQVIREVTKAAKFTEAEQGGVWDMFLRGGANPVVGSLGNAITAHSQVVPDPDRAAELDAKALPLMREAVKVAARVRAAARAGDN